MYPLKSILLLLFALWFSGTIVKATPVIIVDDDFQSLNLATNFEFKITDDLNENETFKNVEDRILVLGNINREVEVRTKIYNASSANQELVLQVSNSNINRFSIELFHDEDLIDFKDFGDKNPFHQRTVLHRNFIYKIHVESFDTLLVNLNVKAQKEPFYLPITLSKKETFYKRSTKQYLFLGSIIGTYLIYISIVFALYFAVRNKLFLWYGIIDTFLLLFMLCDTGMGFQFLWSKLPFFQDIVVVIAGTGYLIGLVSFSREFLSTSIKYPKYDLFFKSVNLVALLSGITLITAYIFSGSLILIPTLILNVLLYIVGAVIFGLGLITYLQSRRKEGFWFLLFFVFQLVIWILFLNQRMYWNFNFLPSDSLIYNFLPIDTATPHFIFINVIVEIIVVSGVIAYSFQDVLNEYNVSKLKMQEINQESIKAFFKGQEVERKVLADRLDKRVGLELQEIKRQVTNAIEQKPKSNELLKTLEQILDVEKDLGRIASDYVIDWQNIELQRIVEKVHEQLKMAMPELKIELDLKNDEKLLDINDLTKLNVYRILQEVCNNIIKHSYASEVTTSLFVFDKNLIIEVADNGIGFSYNKKLPQKGIGLRNIETRVKALNGELKINTAENEGAKIILSIPLQNDMV